MTYRNESFPNNCTNMEEVGYDGVVFLVQIVGAVCAFSFLIAGIIYCFRDDNYASSLKKGEMHCILEAISIIAFVYDVVSDVFLSIQYYMEGKLTFFVLTTLFTIAPVFCSYIAIIAVTANQSASLAKCFWCIGISLAVLFGPIAAVFVHIVALTYSLGCGPGKKIPFEFSPAVQAVLEINFEAVPQLLLQIYININTNDCGEEDMKTRLLRYVAVGGSVLDIVVAMYAYKNHVAERKKTKTKIHCGEKMLSFFKNLFLIGARIIIFALFISEYLVWFYLFAVYRILVCSVFSCIKTYFKKTSKPKEERSFVKYLIFSIIDASLNFSIVVNFAAYKERNITLKFLSYFFIYLENIALFTIWCMFTTYRRAWYYWPSIGITITCCVFHIIFQIFYQICKRNNKIYEAKETVPSPNQSIEEKRY